MSRNEKEIIKIMQKHIFDELDNLKEKDKNIKEYQHKYYLEITKPKRNKKKKKK